MQVRFELMKYDQTGTTAPRCCKIWDSETAGLNGADVEPNDAQTCDSEEGHLVTSAPRTRGSGAGLV